MLSVKTVKYMSLENLYEYDSTSRHQYTLTEQSYTQAPTKQSNETCNMLVDFIHRMYKFDMI